METTIKRHDSDEIFDLTDREHPYPEWVRSQCDCGGDDEVDALISALSWQDYVHHDDFSRDDLGLLIRTECECECECGGWATTTSEGVPLCAECAEYVVDEDGDCICSRDPRTEIVTETCGAGGQTRSYVRLSPPDMPEEDPDGDWEVWWETAGDGSQCDGRYATRAEAEQAIEAHDWPPPGDHTQYACGYGLRFRGSDLLPEY